MAPTELLFAFLVSTALFAFIPGPAMIYAAARTLAGGRRAGLMAALGVHVGGYAHVIAAATGLTLLFHAVPMLYAAVKLAGAAYLLFMGWRLATAAAPATTARPTAQTPRRAFAESIAVEVLNPKTAIFFLAFLPQFVAADAALPVSVQLLLLGVVTNLMFSLADIFAVLMASTVLSRVGASPSLGRWLRRAAGTLLIGLGLRLAFERS